ncbi:iron/ascorbate oxidoreductase [Macrolepiota fuliginosa MF-IS2]|uniref:Iron/ascorbate oxidoreductase n=1 Tax=Macrolepiota fuliginosa MF-IS2 TaxID=1400762 RepID=A0A9P6C1L0_9AGAR|nr:iron/ascorbate oxidoreductase [Macrolepiota fuliginosa MF-IS2]
MSISANNFSSIPILDYSLLANETGRDAFISQLRHALVNVGFLYLKNHPVPQDVVDKLIGHIPKLFDLPQEAKDKIKMANSEHFLGYSRLGTELTKGQVDQREQFDFGTKHKCRWQKGDPDYYRLWGSSQWPDEALIPGFRETLEKYLEEVADLSYKFSSLIAEAFGLGPNGLAHFYDTLELMQHRGKIVKYPVVVEGDGQGVGPHYDAGFLTFLLQASPHEGLQVQNLSGAWIDAPPIPGTFVINLGKALEFVTLGIARATSHRVLSPKGNAPRYSVPFFQNISLNIRLTNEVLEFPPEILKLRDERGMVAATDSVNFSEFDKEPSGRVNLMGRVKSHPETAEIHYPELFKEIFPHGYSGKASAY